MVELACVIYNIVYYVDIPNLDLIMIRCIFQFIGSKILILIKSLLIPPISI